MNMQKISEYQIGIKDVFEGPLDLLMHLIRVNEIDIYDIPISFILDKYLSYLKTIEKLDINISSEFLLMVATLLEIKSRMLLPTSYLDNLESDDEWLASLTDPRHELVRALVFNDIHRRIEDDLREHEESQMRVFPAARRNLDIDSDSDVSFDLEKIGLFDLLTAYQQMLLREKPETIYIKMPTESLEATIDELIAWRGGGIGKSTFREAVGVNVFPAKVIIVFLAILELARIGYVEIEQNLKNGEIRMYWK
jgi:segregation and condensation protein A